MDERIKELAEQAILYANDICNHDANADWYEVRDTKFAELVRQDERERVYNTLISGDCDGSVKTYIRKILEQGANNR
jgi:hypothetical protein